MAQTTAQWKQAQRMRDHLRLGDEVYKESKHIRLVYCNDSYQRRGSAVCHDIIINRTCLFAGRPGPIGRSRTHYTPTRKTDIGFAETDVVRGRQHRAVMA